MMRKRVRRKYMTLLIECGLLDLAAAHEASLEIGLPPLLAGQRLPTTKRTEGAAGVYVLRAPDGLYKIGSSRNAAARLVTLQTGSPVPLGLILTIPTKQHLHNALERTLHHRLADKRVRGEWFALSPADVDGLRLLASHAAE